MGTFNDPWTHPGDPNKMVKEWAKNRCLMRVSIRQNPPNLNQNPAVYQCIAPSVEVIYQIHVMLAMFDYPKGYIYYAIFQVYVFLFFSQ